MTLGVPSQIRGWHYSIWFGQSAQKGRLPAIARPQATPTRETLIITALPRGKQLPTKRMNNLIRCCVLALLGAFELTAAEFHGTVKFGGLPLPGAGVTAAQGAGADVKRFVTVTNEDGIYSFPDLPDGPWTIQVDMLCFAPAKQDVTVGANAPALDLELKLLPLDEIKTFASAAPPPPTRISRSSRPLPCRPENRRRKARARPTLRPPTPQAVFSAPP